MQRTTGDDASLLRVALHAARQAAVGIRTHAQDLSAIDWQVKSRADFVSIVDHEAEATIAEVLTGTFPEATVVGEELSPEPAGTRGLAFIVDPLDGTTNFLHGYPNFAVSIGAAVDGELRAGVVLDVSRNVAFTATAGGGAHRDGTPIRVSSVVDPGRALVGTGFPFKHPGQLPTYLPQFARIIQSTAGVRRAGAAALDLADVACGRFDAFWELMLAPWDMAAGMLLVREAGGLVTDLHGGPLAPAHSGLVASNGHMHPWMLAQLHDPA
ncbi:MAG: inositol monophosphatase [Gemmatimonadetes bacterium]|nr:inositol monophosphatase [Gemmatimonadota bacterium]